MKVRSLKANSRILLINSSRVFEKFTNGLVMDLQKRFMRIPLRFWFQAKVYDNARKGTLSWTNYIVDVNP